MAEEIKEEKHNKAMIERKTVNKLVKSKKVG